MLITNILSTATASGSQVNPQRAVGLINHEDALVFDVRGQADYDRGHILNAIHVPIPELEDKLEQLAQFKDRVVIICCQSGTTSAQASGVLSKAGFSKLYRMNGGIAAWQGENMPLASN